jgi:hypothetical protein
MSYLSQLRPGSRFNLSGMPEVWGELIECSESSAKVRIFSGAKLVAFGDRNYAAQVSKVETWAPGAEVESWE